MAVQINERLANITTRNDNEYLCGDLFQEDPPILIRFKLKPSFASNLSFKT